ncbi:MAG TPA: YdcF family protein [Pyrinomonadaceae bacterium]
MIKGYISKRRVLLLLLLGGALFFLPQIFLTLHFKNKIYSSINDIPPKDFAIVFGAAVRPDSGLSDVARERIAAAVLLYQQGKVKKLFISGDNRHHREVEAIAQFAINQGVPEKDLIPDALGIDTGDSCRNFKSLSDEAILVTQRFHLPRSLLMCEKNQIRATGLAANELELLESRGDNFLHIYSIRLFRFLRESLLTWAFLTGLYNHLSNEAEVMQLENARS